MTPLYTQADLEKARAAYRAWHDARGQHETMPQMIASLLAAQRQHDAELCKAHGAHHIAEAIRSGQ